MSEVVWDNVHWCLVARHLMHCKNVVLVFRTKATMKLYNGANNTWIPYTFNFWLIFSCLPSIILLVFTQFLWPSPHPVMWLLVVLWRNIYVAQLYNPRRHRVVQTGSKTIAQPVYWKFNKIMFACEIKSHSNRSKNLTFSEWWHSC